MQKESKRWGERREWRDDRAGPPRVLLLFATTFCQQGALPAVQTGMTCSAAAGAAGIEMLLAPPPTATAAADCLAALPTIARTHYQRVGAIPWEDYDLAIEAGGPLPRGSLAADDELLMTNPSVICHQGRLLVAVRVMSPPQVQPPCTDIWRSYVVLTELTHSAAAATDGSPTPGRMLTRGCAVDVSAASVEAFGEPTGSAQQQVCCTAALPAPLHCCTVHRCTAAPVHPCTCAPVHACTVTPLYV